MKGLLGKLGLVVLLLASTAIGQTGTQSFFIPQTYNYTGGGARATGMGGAFLGISDDISAVTWNPAGLYGIEKPTLGLSYNGFTPRGKFSFSGQEFKQDRSFGNLAMASFASPIRIKGHPFVMSLSYTQNWDEYESSGFETSFRLDGDGDADQFDSVDVAVDINSDYYAHVNTVNVGFGTRIKQNLQFGFAVNVYTGASQGTFSYYEECPDCPNPLDGIQHVVIGYDSTRIDSATYSGINFTMGFKYLAPKLTAGLVVRTPFSLKQLTDERDATVFTIQGLVWDDRTQTRMYDNKLTKISIPLTIGAGVGYKLKENLLVGLDAELRSFSGGKYKVRDSIVIIPGAKDEEYYTEDTTGFRNVITIRSGVEYLWNTNSRVFPIVPLRVGLAYVPIPAPAYDASGNPKTAAGMSFSLGTGAQWSQIHLDLAYQYQTINREYENFGAKLENKSHRFQASFTGVF